MRFRLKIDDHDYETKKNHIERFLTSGDKVKVTIMFRGREQSRPEMGRKLLQRLAEDVADISVIENAPTQEGRNMSLVLGPVKKKAQAKAEARRAREAAAATSSEDTAPAPKKAPAKKAASTAKKSSAAKSASAKKTTKATKTTKAAQSASATDES